MRAISSFAAVFIHREAVDMRRGINGLSEIVEKAQMGQLSGNHIFVFCGKRRHSIKVLYFDKSGFCLWQKRLESAKFPWPKKISDPVVVLTPEQFSWLMEGYDVWKMKPFSEIHFSRLS